MGELDYQMALLLQHKFEQEHRSIRDSQKSDQELARLLQEKFEAELKQPGPSSVDSPQPSSSKCLTDTSWELVDPTPDVHNLFVVFNKQFFWGALGSVCVSWSKRMTSCAGICSYNGRGGMCSITLSEPLLKLRPRKDLVETLLHEMIHAYLFVTHNNRDRDGHGPEFHKHMFRINKESGTNITVYHSFHDEVRLYQQHWWRCSGPCQHRRPYFGIVRRAINRAPGPNDRWWAEHTKTCGGTFTKVREPEKKPTKAQKKPKPETRTNNPDIRNYIPPIKPDNNLGVAKIHGFNDFPKSNGRVVSNSSSTIVVTKTKTNNSNEGLGRPTPINSGLDKPKPPTETSCTPDFLAVRNRWQNKFNDNAKRPLPQIENNSSKVPKITNNSPSTSIQTLSKTKNLSSKIDEIPKDLVDCPICSKKIAMTVLNDHLDVCLAEFDSLPVTELKECPLCNKKVAATEFDVHVEQCLMKIYDEVEAKYGETQEEKVACLACGKQIAKGDLNTHLDECMSGIFKGDVGDEVDKVDKKEFNCPFCLKMVDEKDMKIHIDACLKCDEEGVVSSLINTEF